MYDTGDGVFARGDLEAGQLVSIYNGVRMSQFQSRQANNAFNVKKFLYFKYISSGSHKSLQTATE